MKKAERDAAYDAWLSHLTFDELQARLRALGVTRVVIKRLSPKQDNSKNQIYWQGNLNANPLPMGDFMEFESSSEKKAKGPAFKAKLDFAWLTSSGVNPAHHAQLISYPQYPETRLGGLLLGAEYAPRTLLSGRSSSTPNRLLLLGAAGTRVIGVALFPNSPATQSLEGLVGSGPFGTWEIAPQSHSITAVALLAELRGVYDMSPVTGCKIKGGVVVPSKDQNVGGTTLETLLGVRPNARDEPDFHGWELKSYSSSRVTLMTPAPTGGAIMSSDPSVFMRKFGWPNEKGTRWDFNGAHTATRDPQGKATTRMILTPSEIQLVHKSGGDIAMSWRISDLLTHWSRKHSLAAYVRRPRGTASGLTYGPYVQLGQGVDWNRFRNAFQNGTIALDPAYNWITGASKMNKERAQFRCYPHELASLYERVSAHDLRHSTSSRRLAGVNLQAEGIVLPGWI